MSSKHPRRNWEHRREQRRIEAEERNQAYQKLSFDDKMSRNSTKVQAKLKKQNVG